MIQKLFKDHQMVSFFSFLIGMGFAVMLFRKTIPMKEILALPVSEIEGKPISYGGKCYQFHAEDTQCEILPSK